MVSSPKRYLEMTDTKIASPNFIYGLYTCRLLSSVLNGTEPEPMPEGMTIESLYAYQSRQDVTNMAYVALQKLGYSDDELKLFLMDYKKAKLRVARFEIGGQQLFATLEKAHVSFIPLKGALLKDLYPNPAMRYFTDYDIYVGSEIDRAEQVMFDLGYEKKTDFETNDVSYVKEPTMHIELHKDLFPDDYDFEGYFDDPFPRTYLKDDCQYHHPYRNDDFFIHVLCHLYKHFTFGGCGLKQYLDIYVMQQKMELDWGYIRSELASVGLDGFLDTTLKLTGYFFGGDELDDELIEIAGFVFGNTTFGSTDNRLVLDYDKGHGEKRTFWKQVVYFADRWQLNFSQMKPRYPILKYLPFLLPFCYIHRLLAGLIFRRDTVKSSFKDVSKMNSDHSNYINHIMKISKAKVSKKTEL